MNEDKDQKITMILYKDLYEWVRAFAFNERVSMATVIRRAVEEYKKKVERKQSTI